MHRSNEDNDHPKGLTVRPSEKADCTSPAWNFETPYPAEAVIPEWVTADAPGEQLAAMSLQSLEPEETRKVDPVIARCAKEPENDLGNCQRLLHHYSTKLLHVREVGWHQYDGTHWDAADGKNVAIKCAQRVSEHILKEADIMVIAPSTLVVKGTVKSAVSSVCAPEECLEAEQSAFKRWGSAKKHGMAAADALAMRQAARRRFAVSSGNGQRIRQMLHQAKPYCTVAQDALDLDPLAFNVRNGTLRFVKQPGHDGAPDIWIAQLHPHNPADYISKVAPVDYDPAAKCPAFDAFMERFQPIESVRLFLQTYHGYALTGLTGEQCLIFNIGVGSNGKSSMLEVICRIMGSYAQTLPFASILDIGFGRRGDQATPDIARLPGARLVRASEPPKGARFDEALIKGMTGGEPMLVRHLNKGFFEFRPVFKLALSGNHRPQISGVDHGIWRRMRMVPWPVKLEDHEKRPQNEVLAELMADASGILNWLVKGALIYLNQGLIVPTEVKNATDDYREEMDPIGGFIRDCVTQFVAPLPQDPSYVSARDMYGAFVSWCHANSVEPWTEKSFALAMQQKGFKKDRSMTVRRYIDVQLHHVPAHRNPFSDPPHELPA